MQKLCKIIFLHLIWRRCLDIKLLNQLEGEESHSKSHKKLCNCGVNYTKYYYIICIVLRNNSNDYILHYGDNELEFRWKGGVCTLQIPCHKHNSGLTCDTIFFDDITKILIPQKPVIYGRYQKCGC